MSIVKMKRLNLIAMKDDCARLMREIAKLGVIELSETEPLDGVFAGRFATDEENIRESLSAISSAEEAVKKYGTVKRGMFSPRIEISEGAMFSSEKIMAALDAAEEINRKERRLSELLARESALLSKREGLVPWEKLSVPLDTESGKFYRAVFATLPSVVSVEAVETALRGASENSEIYFASSDKDQHYVFLLYHADDEGAVNEALKPLGFAKVRFKGLSGTALSQIKETDKKIKEIRNEREDLIRELSESGKDYDLLITAREILENRLECELALSTSAVGSSTAYLSGWVPAREGKRVSEFCEKNGAAYEIRDPADGEEPPTLTYNSRLAAPFGVITNMYSPPAYTGIDPNPYLGIFFALFFGIMFSDAAYGVLLAIVGALALIVMKPRGGFKSFMQLAVICGISTTVFGLLFGGVFGDAIPTAYNLFTGKEFPHDMALWFNPMNDPMKMLIFSFILGALQIVVGMAIKGYMMIRDGEVWAAIFDIGFWWVFMAGAVIALVGNSQVGLIVLGAGALGLVLTQGRAKKGIFGKLFGGIMSLYDVTGYFSDILSYSRLLALSLATAVVASVINTMGALTGVVGFFIVFIIGHVFNIAINLIGTFVHSARLQYVEFFGKFYEGGGRLFKPLGIKTKNVDIIKEEK